MNVRPVLLATVAAAVVFGGPLFLAPEALYGIFGIQMDIAGLLAARVLGASWLGYALLNWLATSAGNEAQRNTLYADLTLAALGLPVTAWTAMNGIGNQLVWIWPLIFAGFAAAYVYVLWFARGMISARPRG